MSLEIRGRRPEEIHELKVLENHGLMPEEIHELRVLTLKLVLSDLEHITLADIWRIYELTEKSDPDGEKFRKLDKLITSRRDDR